MPWSQKKLQEHLTTEKNKANDSVTQVKNRSETVRDQTSAWTAVSSAVAWSDLALKMSNSS